jgi:acetyl esterase
VLCRHAGVHVLAVEYRKAPEHPFPAAVHDARAAFAWAAEHARELGADPGRTAVGGDSAGGNLSAVVSRLAKRDGGPAPALQLLIYPATDIEHELPSVGLFGEGFYLTRADRDWYHAQYLDGRTEDDPLDSPLLEGDLSGLPPALVATAAFDPLRDEGEAYAQALRDAGVPVVARRFRGLVHGFINMTALNPASHDALVEIAGGVRSLLSIRPGAIT